MLQNMYFGQEIFTWNHLYFCVIDRLRYEAAYWDARVYIRIFLDWMGFDRETKTDFLTAFLISLAFFVESCICDGRTRVVSQSYINRSRQTNVNWNR